MSTRTGFSSRFIQRIMVAFALIVALVGLCYVALTLYLTRKYFAETTQQLNAELAQHLIDEKFADSPPFLPDGTVNKPLFGDLMHDMMAVNRGHRGVPAR